ncbi:MFS transporter [Actinomadura sp. WMMB 499]|uniref:MFS transporter n=1 Tax=Actinomadura sp. WMMB 499 TaxID=1219491 RepID=UPI001245ADD6|nr:MFS transporter [Actinomadura sp. WMMB 499]QFG26682.1 MFS transporter [Actinomadura sp. WMMB 499]
MITVVVCVQLSAAFGYWAVMSQLVVHLRAGVGLLAGTIALVLGLRVAVQYALFLPLGALVDQIGPRRAGILACGLRAVAFGLLGGVGDVRALLGTALLIAVGGALLHPAAQSLLAGLPPARRSRGFAVHVVSGQVAAVVGPPAGLVLLGGGFGFLAAVAAAAWTVAALLFALLPRAGIAGPGGPGGGRGAGGLVRGVVDVVRDRSFLRFCVVVAPTTLLATQAVTVVPLSVEGPGPATLFFCASAVATAGVQPFVAGRGERPWVLRGGLSCAGASYLFLAALPHAGDGRTVALVAAAVLTGLGTGLVDPGAFQTIVRCAPEGRVGVYNGLARFLAGAVAFVGGLAVGELFEAGAAAVAMAGLAALGFLSAAVHRHPRVPRRGEGRCRESRPGPGGGRRRPAPPKAAGRIGARRDSR